MVLREYGAVSRKKNEIWLKRCFVFSSECVLLMQSSISSGNEKWSVCWVRPFKLNLINLVEYSLDSVVSACHGTNNTKKKWKANEWNGWTVGCWIATCCTMIFRHETPYRTWLATYFWCIHDNRCASARHQWSYFSRKSSYIFTAFCLPLTSTEHMNICERNEREIKKKIITK